MQKAALSTPITIHDLIKTTFRIGSFIPIFSNIESNMSKIIAIIVKNCYFGQFQEVTKTELKQLTDYQTFIVLDSREDIPTVY
jgi:hypothetical protein